MDILSNKFKIQPDNEFKPKPSKSDYDIIMILIKMGVNSIDIDQFGKKEKDEIGTILFWVQQKSQTSDEDSFHIEKILVKLKFDPYKTNIISKASKNRIDDEMIFMDQIGLNWIEATKVSQKIKINFKKIRNILIKSGKIEVGLKDKKTGEIVRVENLTIDKIGKYKYPKGFNRKKYLPQDYLQITSIPFV